MWIFLIFINMLPDKIALKHFNDTDYLIYQTAHENTHPISWTEVIYFQNKIHLLFNIVITVIVVFGFFTILLTCFHAQST